MKRLKPIRLKESYYNPVKKEIEKIFDEFLYRKLFNIIPKEIKNSIDDPLFDAINKGVVWYQDGRLFGSFNSKIGKKVRAIGGKFNRASKTYSIPSLPTEYRLAVAGAESRYKDLRQQMIATLDGVDYDEISVMSEIPDTYVETLDKMNKDIEENLKSVSISAKMTIEQRNIIASQWGYNLDLYVQGWLKDNILKMRKDISEGVLQGQRAESISKYIQDNFNVSRRKAQFLARQETSLLMSKFHESRYKDAGVTKYIWSGAMDERERADHKALEGQVITWDSPPVVDRKTGRRAHAGEDFGCRCVAVPVVD